MRTKKINKNEIKNILSDRTLHKNGITLNYPDEIFVQIPRYDKYFISNYGRLLHRNNNGFNFVKAVSDNNGYYHFSISKPARRYNNQVVRDKNGKPKKNTKHLFVHRMVAEIYINSQYPEEYTIKDLQVHHKDHDRGNNYYKNLMYLSKNKNGRTDHDLVNSFKKVAIYNQETTKFYSYNDIELLVNRVDVSLLEFLDAIRYADNTFTSQDGKWTMYNINGTFVGIQYYTKKSKKY